MSELYCLSTFFIMCFALIWCVYLGRTAIFVFTVGCILVSNCTVTKQVNFLGITTSLAVFIFSVTYLASDIVTEYWGKVDALKLVVSNLAAQIAFMAYSQSAIWTPPAKTDLGVTCNRHLVYCNTESNDCRDCFCRWWFRLRRFIFLLEDEVPKRAGGARD